MSKKVIIFTIISIVVLIFGIAMTIIGILNVSTVHVEKNFTAEHLEERDIFIYLPPGYDLSFAKTYPVLYLLDGETFFNETREEDKINWTMKGILDRLIKANEIEEIIVVAIGSSTAREAEYRFSVNQENESEINGQHLSSFITDELKPYIDQRFRTKPEAEHTLIAGKELAGLAALHIGSIDYFSKVGALSPTIFHEGSEVFEILQYKYTWRQGDVSIWVDEYSDLSRLEKVHGEALLNVEEYKTALEDYMLHLVQDNNEASFRLEEVKLQENDDLTLEGRLKAMLLYHFRLMKDHED